MRKIWNYLIALVSAAALFAACDKEKEPESDVKPVATIAQQTLVEAFSTMYSEWESTTAIPASLKVGDITLTQPQYQYALCTVVTNIIAGTTSGDVDVFNYKAAEHPDRDSYEAETIAVKGDESVQAVAANILAAVKEKGQIPNQTVFYKNGSAIAFSTNRATVTLARTLSLYKKDGKLPESVSTDYLGSAATLKGFAEALVSYLDIWKNTTGDVSADASHCTDRDGAWKNVHFIPIPFSGGAYADGKDQYDAKYQPYHTITVAGQTYTAAECFVVAAKGFLDLVTPEGSATKQVERNTPVHTLGNGKALTEKIPSTEEWAVWGAYPWYESTNEGEIGPMNFSAENPCDVAFMVRAIPWFLKRAPELGMIGNFLNFEKDPDNSVVMEPYHGYICSMRAFLVLCRFYNYLIENKITENVYDAVKNVKFDYDLYGVEMPDIELQTKNLDFSADAKSLEAAFIAKEAWTAEATADWITVDPASGAAASPAKIKVSVKSNIGDAREGKVIIKGGNVTEGLEISIKQAEYVVPSEATIRDFAIEFVKCLPLWEKCMGTVDAEGVHCTDNNSAWENVHFIPIGEPSGNPYGHDGNQYDSKWGVWSVKVGDTEYTSAQAWEIAVRAFLNLVTVEGEGFIETMQKRNDEFTYGDGCKLSAQIPSATKGCQWGVTPWYEYDNSGNKLVEYNGEAISTVGVKFIVKATSIHLGRAFVKNGWCSSPLGKIGNFQQFGTDASSTIVLEGYNGLISPVRELYILARAYKYILDNDITENVYTALKDQQFDFDMYHQGETF